MSWAGVGIDLRLLQRGTKGTAPYERTVTVGYATCSTWHTASINLPGFYAPVTDYAIVLNVERNLTPTSKGTKVEAVFSPDNKGGLINR